ncbi:hypothetical protein Angca_003116 [Angiostrongylus cantonensis]|nr:hypothetical protein Angca_003116 [Angiostrongylus cantonensis]
MIPALLVLLQFFPLAELRSSECPERVAPTHLAAVTVWTREFNGSSLYRISDEDLSDEGYHRGTADREDVVVLLAKSPGQCTLGLCTLALSTNARISDGVVSHQENVLGTPDGFTNLRDTFYCVRRHGDCGAQRPVFRFTKGSGLSIVYAYSLDPETSFPGYSTEGKVLCYGWADNESVVHPMSNDRICLPVNAVANGKISYSSSTSSIYSIGTTATLECDEGYVNGGQSTVLCVKSGWYPASGLGYCVEQNNSLVHSDTSLSASSSSMECAALGKIRNGQLTYSGLAKGEGFIVGRFPQGTHAIVACDIGYNLFGSANSVCKDGKWNRKHGVCYSKLDPICPTLKPPAAGKISYSTLEPYTPSTTATMSCDFGLSVLGASSLRCTMDGWFPPEGFGVCRVETAGLGCLPVIVLGGTPSYIQSNLQLPYSSGTSVFVVCNIGYIPQGSMSALCQNGVWTPTLGTCVLSPAAVPVERVATCEFEIRMSEKLKIWPKQWNTGARVDAPECGDTGALGLGVWKWDLGTSLMTSSVPYIPSVMGRFSGMDGQEPNSILSCGNPMSANGMVTYSWGTPEEPLKQSGTVALLSCNLGFVPVGSTTSTCRDGIWMPALGICTAEGASTLSCPAMLPALGGTISYSSGSTLGPFESGTMAILRCNKGLPTGTSVSTCLNGQWSPPTLGTCSLDPDVPGDGDSCAGILTPVGGILVYSSGGIIGPFPSGTRVSMQCNIGSPSGATSAICTNGRWNPQSLGTCSSTGGQSCNVLITPLGASLSYSTGNSVGPFAPGTTVTMTCIIGSPLGATSASCSNGQWFPPALGTCNSDSVGFTCPELVVPPAGVVTMTNSGLAGRATQGTVATLRCPFGVQGTASAVCTNGQWTPSQLGTCIGFPGNGASTCSAITTPLGAILSYSNLALLGPFSEGTTVTARCLNGAAVVGISTAKCTGGQWVPATLGTCPSSGSESGLPCPSIEQTGSSVDYSDGQLSTNHPSGTTATLFCNSGIPLGASLSTCQNGQWTPPLGSCPNSGAIQCTLPPALPIGATVTYSSGNMFGPWNSGAVATMACPLAQTVVGSTTSICNNGVWSPLGTCSSSGGGGGLRCGKVSSPQNGVVFYSSSGDDGYYRSGTTVTLVCNLGYQASGATTAVCQGMFWSPSELGQCISAINSGDTTRQCLTGVPFVVNGVINYSNGKQLGPWQQGSTATLFCNNGYVASGAIMSTCMGNGRWLPETLGQCFFTSASPLACEALPFIIGGTVAYSNPRLPPYPQGTTATLNCAPGYTLSGFNTMVCLGGKWSPGLGSCKPNWLQRRTFNDVGGPENQGLFCEAPAAPAFGEITFSKTSSQSGFVSGTTARLRCSFGRSITGPSFSICSQGMFHPVLGQCTNDAQSILPFTGVCLPLTAPTNGRITYIQPRRQDRIEIGTTALLYCLESFAVTGQATVVCTEDGWRPATGLGQCDSTNSISASLKV